MCVFTSLDVCFCISRCVFLYLEYRSISTTHCNTHTLQHTRCNIRCNTHAATLTATPCSLPCVNGSKFMQKRPTKETIFCKRDLAMAPNLSRVSSSQNSLWSWLLSISQNSTCCWMYYWKSLYSWLLRIFTPQPSVPIRVSWEWISQKYACYSVYYVKSQHSWFLRNSQRSTYYWMYYRKSL